jgi:ferredoxin
VQSGFSRRRCAPRLIRFTGRVVEASKVVITAERSSCRGARACVRRAPATFSLDAQRRVVVAAEPGDRLDAILDAARACPNFAIEVRRAGEQLA